MRMDLQLKLLEETHGRSAVENVRNPHKWYSIIDVIGRQDSKIHLLGRTRLPPKFFRFSEYALRHDIFDSSGDYILNKDSWEEYVSTPLDGNCDGLNMIWLFGSMFTLGMLSISRVLLDKAPSIQERKNKTEEYWKTVSRFSKINLDELGKKTQKIGVYQGSMDEVSADIDERLERINTGRSVTFIHERDLQSLREEAYLLNSDAIVHYQPGSSIGTPVRFIGKEWKQIFLNKKPVDYLARFIKVGIN